MADTEDPKYEKGMLLWEPDAISGKEFSGWYLNNVGTSMEAIDNTNATESNKIYGDLNFYGYWQNAKYKITFEDPNTGVLEKYTMTVEYGQALDQITWFAEVEAAYGKGKKISYLANSQGNILISSNGTWRMSTYDRESDLELFIKWTS